MTDLFANEEMPDASGGAPLPERMRPHSLDELVGQDAAFGADTALGAALRRGELPSLILWGPPGCGKTTLAACLAHAVGARFLAHSAVRVGVKEIRQVMEEAKRLKHHDGRTAILFLDEIHRFNKGQQDALLPHVEAGDITLIGATTENPSFQVNAALLSRTRVVTLARLESDSILKLLRRALDHPNGLGGRFRLDDEALELLANRSGGDARFALNNLELVSQTVEATADPPITIELAVVENALSEAYLLYDRAGEEHFNMVSALQKSIRNSDAQAGLYWLARMLEAGEDPIYIARRLTRTASEDIGLADPMALTQCTAALGAVQLMGMPECSLALAQATIYLAQAPKSNAVELAYGAAKKVISEGANEPVPLHLRNAPTKLMKELGYGAQYRYSHDEKDGVAAMDCLPPGLKGSIFYRPVDRGFETEIAKRLREADRLRNSIGKKKGPND